MSKIYSDSREQQLELFIKLLINNRLMESFIEYAKQQIYYYDSKNDPLFAQSLLERLENTSIKFNITLPKQTIQEDYENIASANTSASPQIAKLMQEIISWCGDVSAWDSIFRQTVLEFCDTISSANLEELNDEEQSAFPQAFCRADVKNSMQLIDVLKQYCTGKYHSVLGAQ